MYITIEYRTIFESYCIQSRMNIQNIRHHFTQTSHIEFEGSSRELGWISIYFIWLIADFLNRVILFFQYLLLHPSKIKNRNIHSFSFIPQIGPVQRQTELILFLPYQYAQHTITKRHCFIPTFGNIGKYKIM